MNNKHWISVLVVTLWIAAPGFSAQAQDKGKKGETPHSVAEVQKDIQDHLAMAEAHTAAAKCLQSGKGEKVCHAQLAKDCKGLGIGTLCGMKHRH
ncbi:MAG TPA: hypothetical protein VK642_10995 [Burkholderiales bacterium]|nr:hypothetical protein [Burkholderiales bacterium]